MSLSPSLSTSAAPGPWPFAPLSSGSRGFCNLHVERCFGEVFVSYQENLPIAFIDRRRASACLNYCAYWVQVQSSPFRSTNSFSSSSTWKPKNVISFIKRLVFFEEASTKPPSANFTSWIFVRRRSEEPVRSCLNLLQISLKRGRVLVSSHL